MRNILFTIVMLLPFIGIGQESKLSDLISSQIQRGLVQGDGVGYPTWMTDTPLQLPRTSSLKNVIPQFEGIEFSSTDSEVTLIGEYVRSNAISNYIQYPTFGSYKIYTEKNIGQSNEEGIIIITTVGIGDANYPHSPSGVDEGQKIVITYKIISDTEIVFGYDNKKAFFYEITYDKIK